MHKMLVINTLTDSELMSLRDDINAELRARNSRRKAVSPPAFADFIAEHTDGVPPLLTEHNIAEGRQFSLSPAAKAAIQDQFGIMPSNVVTIAKAVITPSGIIQFWAKCHYTTETRRQLQTFCVTHAKQWFANVREREALLTLPKSVSEKNATESAKAIARAEKAAKAKAEREALAKALIASLLD
jgi:hypothetical protein